VALRPSTHTRGLVQEDIVERGKRTLTDEACLAQLEARVGYDFGFPFGLPDLQHLAEAVLKSCASDAGTT
jgi:hypothetical protein